MTRSELIHILIFFSLMLAIALQWMGLPITDYQLSIVSIIWLAGMIIESIIKAAKEFN